MAPRERHLGWPFLLGSAAILALTVGTFTILGKNVANTVDIPGSRQFESVGAAGTANLVVQLVLAVVPAVLALLKPRWRSAAFVLIGLVSIASFLALNSWAETSAPWAS